MADRKTYNPAPEIPEANSDGNAYLKTVGIEKDVMQSLALHSSQDKMESVYRLTLKAVDRLKLKGGKRFKQCERVHNYPSQHDIARWCEAVKDDERYADDRKFLANLNKTLEGNMSPSVLEEIKKEVLG